MGAYNLQDLVGCEVEESILQTEGMDGRRSKKIKWTVIEAYPHFVKAMRITEDGTEIYNTFNVGTLVTMGAIRLKGVRYIG